MIEAFAATKVNKIFLGNQPRQLVTWSDQRFGNLDRTLMMETEMFPETLVTSYNHLTWLIAEGQK